MIATNQTTDVFLSYAPADRSIAEAIAAKFEEAGLSVFPPYEADISAHQTLNDIYREALAESRAFVVILSRASLRSPMVLVQLGGAQSWDLSVYVLLRNVSTDELPSSMRQATHFQISQVGKVIDAIRRIPPRARAT